MLDPLAAAVLDFWFGAQDPASPSAPRDVWFRKDATFDAEIRQRFGTAIAVALAGGYGEWCATAEGALARVLVLDQFTRNAYRDTPAAFAGDARALATAEDAVERGLDRSLKPFGRWFLYMPFEHAEDREAQRRSLELFGALAEEHGPDRAARMGAKARGRHRAVWPLSASQCDSRPDVDAGRKSRFSASPVPVSSPHCRRSAFLA